MAFGTQDRYVWTEGMNMPYSSSFQFLPQNTESADYGRGGSMPDKSSASEVRVQAQPLGTYTTQNIPVCSQLETAMVNNPLPPVAEFEPISGDHPAVEAFSVDCVSPVIECLQMLEGRVDELGSKPPEIPLEKECSLLDSWDRIKCIESELERTKKVLQATVMKQLEIADLIEEVILSKLHRRRFVRNEPS